MYGVEENKTRIKYSGKWRKDGSTVYRLKSEKETVTDMHRHTRGKTETLINRQIQDLIRQMQRLKKKTDQRTDIRLYKNIWWPLELGSTF